MTIGKMGSPSVFVDIDNPRLVDTLRSAGLTVITPGQSGVVDAVLLFKTGSHPLSRFKPTAVINPAEPPPGELPVHTLPTPLSTILASVGIHAELTAVVGVDEHGEIVVVDGAHGDGKATREGVVVFVCGAKGGIGKTTTATTLAQAAGELGLRACLVDMNRNQADIAVLLKLEDAPTISDLALGHARTPADIVHVPTGRESIRSHVVLGPPSRELSDPNVVTADLYKHVIDWLRGEYHLVVVDTQTAEDHPDDLWEKVVFPTLAEPDTTMLLVTSPMPVSVHNTGARLDEWFRSGLVDRRNVLVVVNGVLSEEGSTEHLPLTEIQRRIGPLAPIVAVVHDSPRVREAALRGEIDFREPSVGRAMSGVLRNLIGVQGEIAVREAEKKRRWWRWR